MYRNIVIDGHHTLIVIIAGHTYILGRTGPVHGCQRLNYMRAY